MVEYYMGQERRMDERISYHAPCRYEISSDEGRSTILGSGTSFIKNISLGGLLLELRKLISVNSHLDLEVVLPTAPGPVRTQARVVWVSKLKEDGNRYNVGMCFIDISSDDKEKIASIRRKIKDGKTP